MENAFPEAHSMTVLTMCWRVSPAVHRWVRGVMLSVVMRATLRAPEGTPRFLR